MSIHVICRGCRTIYEVEEKFAGRSSPCPKCKTIIHIPDAKEAPPLRGPVIIGDEGKGFRGEHRVKPIPRAKGKWNPLRLCSIAGAAIIIVLLAWLGGNAGLFEYAIIYVLGLIVVSPLLTWAAYAFLQDEELEPYRGAELLLRCGICAVVYMLLWGCLAYLFSLDLIAGEFAAWNWLFVAPPLLAFGAAAAHYIFDFEPGNSFFHYCFYVLTTIVLWRIAGHDWIWNL
jgi:hypothetical protein